MLSNSKQRPYHPCAAQHRPERLRKVAGIDYRPGFRQRPPETNSAVTKVLRPFKICVLYRSPSIAHVFRCLLHDCKLSLCNLAPTILVVFTIEATRGYKLHYIHVDL